MALALLAILAPSVGWQTLAQMPGREIGDNSPDDDENEGRGEDEDGNSAEGAPGAHLLFHRSQRQSRRGNLASRLVSECATACLPGVLHNPGAGHASSAARLPLRC